MKIRVLVFRGFLVILILFVISSLFHKYTVNINKEGQLRQNVKYVELKQDKEIPVNLNHPRSGFNLTGQFSYDGRNLLDDPPHTFDSHFKNPCWWDEGALHCLPYMYIIGAKKCGTSDLFYRTGAHPDFVRPGFKEAQFYARKRFSNKFTDTIDTYVEMFDEAALTIAKLAKRGTDGRLYNNISITGEGSPSNLHLNSHWQNLPGNEGLDEPKYVILDYIHHFTPDAKIIITFRDPVERLYSDYYHEYGSLKRVSDPNPDHFHTVVHDGIKLYNECFNQRTVRSCAYDHELYDVTKIQIQLGIFYIFWQDLARLFKREQILVLQNKQLRDKEATMKTVHKFLGLRTLNDEEMKKVVNAKEGYPRNPAYVAKGPMLNKTLEMLQDFYRPFNKKMADISADTAFLYGY